MAFPEVLHCIVCEDVRHEAHRKLTILGMFGILPDVEIRIADITKPIARLSFLVMCGTSEAGLARVTVAIQHEDGTRLLAFENVEVEFTKTSKTNLVLGAINVPVPKPGTYL